ncbi:MAG: SirB2 family protein [Rhodocyclaceae bacterium]
MYYTIKHVHVLCVVLSGFGFLLRGILMLMRSPALAHPVARIAPHVVDTVLLGSAVVLAAMIGAYPFVSGWITAKVVGLIVYIGLGMVALRRGRTHSVKAGTFVAALVVYAWIVSVAMTKNSLGSLALGGV